jgi:A/G-specific adenine glycosylase
MGTSHSINEPAGRRLFQRRLLGWYQRNKRDLPWRANRDPYRVWLSEIMLQQTRVAAVVAYYRRFLQRFPTVEALASASESDVLAAWSGLGYYRRARMLHAAAKVVARERGGEFPVTAEDWKTLPGVGRYTAAAIASIAFGEASAVVDGNVERVLQRINGKTISGERVWQQAESLLDRHRPGDFNQAMMELGATVCTPRAPACLTCPLVELCVARGELAGGEKKSRQLRRVIHYALDRRNGSVLLTQRPAQARLMAGMWELPEIPRPADRNEPLFTVKHSITVTDYTVQVWLVPGPRKGEWWTVDRLPRLALTGLARKILRKSGIISASASSMKSSRLSGRGLSAR